MAQFESIPSPRQSGERVRVRGFKIEKTIGLLTPALSSPKEEREKTPENEPPPEWFAL